MGGDYMKMLKKAATLLLAIILVLGAMSCGSNTDKKVSGSTGQPVKDAEEASNAASSEQVQFPLSEPVTMKMMSVINFDISLDNTLAMKKMEELTNVKWDVQSVTGADLGEKRNLLLASKQYPDVFMKTSLDRSTLDKYGSQGTFIALNDLIDKNAPNILKLLGERPPIKQVMTSGDGNIYSLPQVGNTGPGSTLLFINQGWLDKLSLKMPTNTDELYNVLSAFKTEDPNGNSEADEIPLMCTTGTKVTLLYPYFGITNYGDKTLIDGKLQYIATTEKFKDFLKYCRKLYQDGLLAKDSFTLEPDQQKAIGASGDTLGSFFDSGAFLTVGRDRDENYPAVMPFGKGIFPTNAGAWSGAFAVTDKCEHPDIAVAWADQWYSEEGGRLAWMGVENETYKINDDGSWDWVLGEFGDIGILRANAAIQGSAGHPSIMPELWGKNVSDPNEAKVNEANTKAVALGAEPFPSLNYNDADSKTVASATADLNPYVDQYIAEVVVGRQELDASWDTHIATLKDMGLEKLMTIYTKAYEEAIKQ